KKHPFFGLYYGTAAKDAYIDEVRHLATHGTLGTLESRLPQLEARATPDMAAQPELAEAMLEIDVARLLQNQLNAGIMDEWGWPALDAAHARFGHDVDWRDTHKVFPTMTVWETEPPRVVVVQVD